MEMRDIPFEEVLSYADAVVVVTIGERNPDLEVGLITEPGTPEGNLSEKQEAQGAKPASATFISYQAQVKEAVAGAEVGQEINLIVSEELQSVEPVLQPGMEILTAIKKGIGEEQQNNYSFTRYGTYYVVDDNYVLSAFEAEDQDTSTFTEDTNGKTLENLIEKVQEIKAE
ncbi:hypothetical protein [Saccharibacillus sacchari]|uniref:Uncharacterized protein n=1 Tax=Saccharibacillus sacchari TaxID=456493 RepID=A0ACC6PJ89_9BACL